MGGKGVAPRHFDDGPSLCSVVGFRSGGRSVVGECFDGQGGGGGFELGGNIPIEHRCGELCSTGCGVSYEELGWEDLAELGS